MIDSLGFELFPQGPDGQAAVDTQTPREDLLLELARCCSQVQRCLRTAPHLPTIAPALDEVEGLDAARSGRSAALAQWWATHSVIKLNTASLASLLLRLVDLEEFEELAFVHTRQSEREAIEALLLTRGEACELQRVWLVVGQQRIALPGTYAGIHDPEDDVAPTDLLVHCVTLFRSAGALRGYRRVVRRSAQARGPAPAGRVVGGRRLVRTAERGQSATPA